MKNKKMKLVALLFIVSLILTLFAGCGNNEQAEQSDGGTNKPAEEGTVTGDDTGADADAVKTAGYPKSLSYWVGMTSYLETLVKNLGETPLYKEIEKKTGTHVDFKHPSGTNAEEQFNLMIASGNFPDVIETNWITVPRGPDNAIKEGTIIRLNELIDQYAPNLTQYLNANPDVKKMITSDEGNIYAFPFIREDESLMVYSGNAFRQDWLDTLNLKVPTTIAEWETVLTAFRDQDPNGNKQKDEIPYLINLSQVKNNVTNSMIGTWGIAAEFYQVDGKVKYGSIQPEFKQFLAVMHDWYEKGLIDPDFAATDGKLFDAKITSSKLGAAFMNTGGGIGKYAGLMKDDPNFKLVPAPYPSLEPGGTVALGQSDKAYTGGASAAITTSAENPEEIVKWLDFAYGEEGHMLFNFGLEGTSYTMVDGFPTYTDLIMKNPDGLPLSQAMSLYIRGNYSGPFVQDKRYITQYASLPEQQESLVVWSKPANKMMMPLITQTAEENKEFASIMSDVSTYWDEMVTQFIMGDQPIENFDSFVETIKGMGVERAVELQQQALDRYNKR